MLNDFDMADKSTSILAIGGDVEYEKGIRHTYFPAEIE